MSDHLLDAFGEVCEGYSPDRVVADPAMNIKFIAACERRGVAGAPGDLNRTLLNARKQGKLTGRSRSKRTQFDNEDEYRFAAEMAVRFMERKHSVSIDTVICVPVLVEEFDRLAADICPGYSELQYRWAALNLRKSKKLTAEIAGRVVAPENVEKFRANEIIPAALPSRQGLYLFFDATTLLYVGETENLRKRLTKHLEHSDNKGLARWLWEHGASNLHVEIQILPDVATSIRKALELELIRSRQPIFNVQR